MLQKIRFHCTSLTLSSFAKVAATSSYVGARALQWPHPGGIRNWRHCFPIHVLSTSTSCYSMNARDTAIMLDAVGVRLYCCMAAGLHHRNWFKFKTNSGMAADSILSCNSCQKCCLIVESEGHAWTKHKATAVRWPLEVTMYSTLNSCWHLKHPTMETSQTFTSTVSCILLPTCFGATGSSVVWLHVVCLLCYSCD